MRLRTVGLRNRDGNAILTTTVTIIALFAFMALAVDIGMLYTAHNEAQRAADAAALAGASAFLDYFAAEADSAARARALEYAARNDIRNETVAPDEVTIQVISDSQKVRVGVRREGIGTWFAHFVGVTSEAVSAVAAAKAFGVGAGRCLKPWAMPDLWHNADDDNQIWEEDEVWDYDPAAGDYYRRTGSSDPAGKPETGYASAFRDGVADDQGRTFSRDWGRPMTIKISDPKKTETSSVFRPWVMPQDGEVIGGCKGAGAKGAEPGADKYRTNICGCNTSLTELGVDYDIQPGNMVGPTHDGVQSLISEDPDAYWDESGDTVAGSAYSNWRASPRIVKLALYPPDQIEQPGKQAVSFNNFGLFFIEGQNSPSHPIRGRFLYYVMGSAERETEVKGSLVKTIRLVE